eukprot:824048-Amphidinium_carterae.2
MAYIQAAMGDSLWVLLLDHAPIHVTAELQTKADQQYPQVALVFIDRGCTSVVQPCDIQSLTSGNCG